MSALTDDQVDAWARLQVANAPAPTPTQLDLVRRIFNQTPDTNPVSDAA